MPTANLGAGKRETGSLAMAGCVASNWAARMTLTKHQ